VIFLDEIGDLHMSAQVMLLRALATGEFQPLGDTRTRSVNVRVVAASNRPLQNSGLGEHFRHDLFFRLRYFHVNLPPLRERGDDWRLLVDYFLARLQTQYGVTKHFSDDASSRRSATTTAGNVRSWAAWTTAALSDGEVIKPGAFVTTPWTKSRGLPDDDIYRSAGSTATTLAGRAPAVRTDLNRSQVKALIRWGSGRGSYRTLHDLNLPPRTIRSSWTSCDTTSSSRDPRGEGVAPEAPTDLEPTEAACTSSPSTTCPQGLEPDRPAPVPRAPPATGGPSRSTTGSARPRA
jgi:DNA-binding NtrC family response regulator